MANFDIELSVSSSTQISGTVIIRVNYEVQVGTLTISTIQIYGKNLNSTASTATFYFDGTLQYSINTGSTWSDVVSNCTRTNSSIAGFTIPNGSWKTIWNGNKTYSTSGGTGIQLRWMPCGSSSHSNYTWIGLYYLLGETSHVFWSGSNSTPIVSSTTKLGVVNIYTSGTAHSAYDVYIYNGSSWDKYIPYIYDGSKFVEYSKIG